MRDKIANIYVSTVKAKCDNGCKEKHQVYKLARYIKAKLERGVRNCQDCQNDLILNIELWLARNPGYTISLQPYQDTQIPDWVKIRVRETLEKYGRSISES